MLEQIRENSANILSTRYKEQGKCERDEDIDSATPQSNREMKKRTMLLESIQERNEIALRRRRKLHVQYKSKTMSIAKTLRCNQRLAPTKTSHNTVADREFFPHSSSDTLRHQTRT